MHLPFFIGLLLGTLLPAGAPALEGVKLRKHRFLPAEPAVGGCQPSQPEDFEVKGDGSQWHQALAPSDPHRCS